ncbi:hypothetical protein EVAR_84288_1 [Eumeta japonica]|uniref:Uncharacterized protein n=1 Tax=Eumeta variegata TaxID=151549 RepID=A0A4C1WT96_EUMVA|nr:hypothetical protein EVAR_84288_1 [Eumeta japonica]
MRVRARKPQNVKGPVTGCRRSGPGARSGGPDLKPVLAVCVPFTTRTYGFSKRPKVRVARRNHVQILDYKGTPNAPPCGTLLKLCIA